MLAYNAFMSIQTKRGISIAILVAAILGEGFGLTLSFLRQGDPYLYFTILGNAFYGLVALVLLAVEIACLAKKKKLPRWAYVLHYVGTVCETITLLTVCLLLVWQQGPGLLYEGAFPFLHLLCPLLALANHYFFLGRSDYRYTDGGFGFIPVLAYAAAIIPLSACGIVKPVYPFLDFRVNSWWLTLLYAVGALVLLWLICYVLIRYGRKAQGLTEKE